MSLLPERTGSAGRIVAEALVIVVSILVAFGVDATWDRYQRSLEQQEVLIGLRSEFSTYSADLSYRTLAWDSIGVEIATLLSAIDDGDAVPLDQIRVSMWGLIYPSTYDPGSGVRDALIASGRLETIERVELRRALVAWEGVLAEDQDNEVAMRAFILQQIIPYLAAQSIPVGALGPSSGGWTAMTEREELAAYRALFADPGFVGLAGVRYFWLPNNLPEYRAATEFADTVLALIDDELR